MQRIHGSSRDNHFGKQFFYRSDTVNSNSLSGEDFLQNRWKYKVIYAL